MFRRSRLDWPIRKNGTARKFFLTFMVLTFLIIFFYYTQFNIHTFEEELVLNYSKPKPPSDAEKYLIHTSKCRIPNDDPFNEEVKPYYHRESYIPCSKRPPLTYIEKKDSSITLRINQSLLETYSMFTISCCWSAVTRVVEENKSDDALKVSDCVPFQNSTTVTESIVLVKCKSPINSEIYSNVHAILNPEHVHQKLQQDWTTTPMSVLFVGIDSISKMNLVRTMPKTYKFLEEHDFANLRGYTKIADNTFPNLMAILTGKTWIQVYDQCDPKKNKINNCDIIWDKFNDLGYITAYAEDESSIGTFNYNRKGFGSPPTDFYFRPYMIAAENLPSIRRFGMHTCSGPETSGERIMNLAKDFAFSFEKNPKFGLFWMNTFSHDNVNLPSSMDEKVEAFLEDIYDHLDNVVLVFFSDHGFRFGDIRYTHTGWVEERLPFIYVHLPKTLKQLRPTEVGHFLTNTRRLTTPFDLYMTLQDILAFTNQSYEVQPSLACPKCHSLFREVDEARTCKDGAIEQHWCMCSGHSYVNPSTQIVVDTAQYIVFEVNSLIQASESGHKCAFYYLKKIVSSGMSELYLNENNQTVHYMLIMLETRPPAMFEATVEVASQPHKLPRFRLLGDISRINRYGDNSKCINDSLKKYCYCDGLFTSIKSAICNFLNCV
ncbi:uncharacterized protein LOC135143718 isoform X3 [Zophobas morio]|uniref:uncharacterized protein LOC135143718 isoform X3 n=1 Tax=Zophobas morio TaxID=2755281 RepID=UPI003083C8D2